MKKPLRILLRSLLGVGIALVVVVIIGLFFLGPTIRATANTMGPALLGVPVEVKGASIRPLSGFLRLTGVRIGNPEGYADEPLFSLTEIRVKLDMSTLRGSEPIVIKEVAIIDPHVAYEVKKGKSNLEVLTTSLPQGDDAKKTKKKDKKDAKPPRKVIIDSLVFRGGELSYRAKMTLGKAVTLPMPNLELTGIGRKQAGITATEALAKVLGELLNVVGTLVAKIGTAAVDAGKAVVETGGAAVKAVGSAASGLVNLVTGDSDKADDEEQ